MLKRKVYKHRSQLYAMQRVNVMISDRAKKILIDYQERKGLSKQDDALTKLIEEFGG